VMSSSPQVSAPDAGRPAIDDGHERLHEDIRRIARTTRELALHLKGRGLPSRSYVDRARRAADLAESHLCNLALVELEGLCADLLEFELEAFENPAPGMPLLRTENP